MLKLIENKIGKTQKKIDQQRYFKSCLFCKFAKRPKINLPYLCYNKKADGFADPWNMPIKNCQYFTPKKE